MTKWLYLLAAIILEVTGTLSLRLAVDDPLWFILVVVGYAGAFVALTLLLRAGAPIGVSYGIWAACGVALTAVLAWVLFGDALTWMMGLGIVIVIGGVLLVEIGSARGETPRATAKDTAS
ncbi:multidrug efflux SMR transporter [Microbacterium sediminicola]|uniref:Multidrug efflux SMR transporter n=1 Tax=Microbacterium sediminicola TaxID=415210 RepID=A0ABP4TPI8_9MICO